MSCSHSTSEGKSKTVQHTKGILSNYVVSPLWQLFEEEPHKKCVGNEERQGEMHVT